MPERQNTPYEYAEPSLADELAVYFQSALDAATLGQSSRVLDAFSGDPEAAARLRTMKREMSPGAHLGGSVLGGGALGALPGGAGTLAARGVERGARAASAVSGTAATTANALGRGLASRSFAAEAARGIDNAITFGLGSIALNGGQPHEMLMGGVGAVASGLAGAGLGKTVEAFAQPRLARNTTPGARAAAVEEINQIPMGRPDVVYNERLTRADSGAVDYLADLAATNPSFRQRLGRAAQEGRAALSALSKQREELIAMRNMTNPRTNPANPRSQRGIDTRNAYQQRINRMIAENERDARDLQRKFNDVNQILNMVALRQATGGASPEQMAAAGLRVPQTPMRRPSGRVQGEMLELMTNPSAYADAVEDLPRLQQQATALAQPQAQAVGRAVGALPRIGANAAMGATGADARQQDLRLRFEREDFARAQVSSAAEQQALDRRREQMGLDQRSGGLARDALATIDRFRHPAEPPILERFDAWLRTIPQAERSRRFGHEAHADYQTRALAAFIEANPSTAERDLATIAGAIAWQAQNPNRVRVNDTVVKVFNDLERARPQE